MSLSTPEKIRTLQRKLYIKAKQEPGFRFYAFWKNATGHESCGTRRHAGTGVRLMEWKSPGPNYPFGGLAGGQVPYRQISGAS